jgi:glucuronokinase
MAEGSAPARAALVGNPSDGYGGAVLAVIVPTFRARARVEVGDAAGGDALGANAVSPSAGNVLVDATAARFGREFGVPRDRLGRLSFETTIPRSVGLGGSSAIIIAALRALCAEHGVQLDPTSLAQLALSVEVDDLGIAAGLQDRLVQSHGGLLFMDFANPTPHTDPLPIKTLPPLLIAWRDHTAEHSGVVHSDLRQRHHRGDVEVVRAMAKLGDLARQSRHALQSGEISQLRHHVDQTFDIRRDLIELDQSHVEMIEIARGEGAAANYTGSGGAIVALCYDLRHRDAVAQVLLDVGCGVVRV